MQQATEKYKKRVIENFKRYKRQARENVKEYKEHFIKDAIKKLFKT